MVAYFQNRVQQGGNVYRSGRPPWRELDGGSGFRRLFLLATGMGILMGAGGALVANAWFMTLYFLIVNIRALAARELQGPDGKCFR